MTKRIKFSDLVPIYRAVEPLPGSAYGISVSNELIKESLALALDDFNIDDSSLSVIEGDYQRIKIGDKFVLKLGPPRIGLGLLVEDFSEYISSAGTKLKEKSHYFFLKSKHYSGDDHVPSIVIRYRRILQFINLIKGAAHYLDTHQEELVFYKEGRFVIPIVYDEKTLAEMSLPELDEIERFLQDKSHKDQKVKIFAENLLEMLAGVSLSDRFSFILQNLENLHSRLQASYSIFAADFTYEKAIAEVHGFKVDVVTKLHKAITDIQAQILGIPIATFVAISQLKKTESLDAQFAANTVIFFGVFVFCLLLFGFLLNQKATLDTIGSEIKRQKDLFVKKFENNDEAYSAEFRAIRKRLLWQYSILYSIGALNILMFLGTVIYYLVHTRPIYNVIF